MDITELEKLVKLMNENDLEELEIEEEGLKVKLRKQSAHGPVVATHYPPMLQNAMATAAGGTAAPVTPVGPPPGTVAIKSPIVGTFYKSSSPETPVYVNVGDRVGPDSVVCIVEAMKVMNEIKAELSGEILEVLVDNGEAVEFDQPLFLVKPA